VSAGIALLRGVAVPLLRDNIDTDAIIPSREMTSVGKTGLANGLFAGWRYTAVGGRASDPGFVLNQPRYANARILLTGANVGCGSSREHAAWALAEYGFRAVVAPSFNPIFRANCVRNGIIPVELDPLPLAAVEGMLEIDLAAQLVRADDGRVWPFAVDAEARAMLLGGLDEIGLSLTRLDEITAFRARDRVLRPWAYLEGVRA
jgi:3-isopropylmalate/(R)-2-methylmalate dehydratase small subunit